jgi:hypothetical protein
MLKPKIAKELVCLPTLFCHLKKQNQDSAKFKINDRNKESPAGNNGYKK